MKRGLVLVLACGLAQRALGECPNACSGKGTCGSYDMCTCYTGFFGNDCSERICPFGMAHVDSPKGDLDMDNDVQYKTVVTGSQMYPDGTSELFPVMAEADGTVLTQTGHYYMECANKGLCDRAAGTCACFTGYEGSSCQRASCPNDCSGHGTCKSNRELSTDDYDNIYELWDADMGMACDCDPNYEGYDCSLRSCPYGVDPMYYDDENTVRVPTWTVHFIDTAAIASASGTWRLKFYDVFGEDWITDPIDIQASCTDVVSALEDLPNDAIAESSVWCSQNTTTLATYFELTFTQSPGDLKIPELIITDEAGRYTLDDSGATYYLGMPLAVVYDTGVTGEFYDYFANKCGVIINPANAGTGVISYARAQTVAISASSTGTLRTLKECLGDSTGVSGDNVGVENWDYGSVWPENIKRAIPDQYPHLVRLVDTGAANEYVGGVHAIMYWDYSVSPAEFVLASTVDPDREYYVYATDGTLERVWYDSNTDGDFTIWKDELGMARWSQYTNIVYTSRDFSCENAGTRGASGVFKQNSTFLYNNCIEKGDLLVFPKMVVGNLTTNVTGDTLPDQEELYGAQNTPYSAGLYEVKKISVEDYTATTNTTEDRYQIVLDRPIFWDGSFAKTAVINRGDGVGPLNDGMQPFFKFSPESSGSNAEMYVSDCSNRGICDESSGLCTCFPGYTNENCDTQSALAI